MQDAEDAKASGMVSVIGLDSDKVGNSYRDNRWGPHQRVHETVFITGNSSRNYFILFYMLYVSFQVAELCKAATADAGPDKPVQIANFLCPGNYAVSGSKEACDIVEKRGKEFKAR
jgi:malonyl CoA-acyl carrier protein transacylase